MSNSFIGRVPFTLDIVMVQAVAFPIFLLWGLEKKKKKTNHQHSPKRALEGAWERGIDSNLCVSTHLCVSADQRVFHQGAEEALPEEQQHRRFLFHLELCHDHSKSGHASPKLSLLSHPVVSRAAPGSWWRWEGDEPVFLKANCSYLLEEVLCVCMYTYMNVVLRTAHGVSLQEGGGRCQALQMKSQF